MDSKLFSEVVANPSLFLQGSRRPKNPETGRTLFLVVRPSAYQVRKCQNAKAIKLWSWLEYATRSDPDRNMHRFYALDVTPTLFGDWSLTAEWGRIGSPGVVQRRTFADEAAASAALTKRLSIKARRGYLAATVPDAASHGSHALAAHRRR
jgi:predicted DNA-binding WGR domain protein